MGETPSWSSLGLLDRPWLASDQIAGLAASRSMALTPGDLSESPEK